MLTGSLPFAATDPMELVHCHIARTPVPPHERVGNIPALISQIVMKLVAKTAEERYQTAAGVEHDLRRCLAEWEMRGRIDEFALAEHDVTDRLLIPERLYGRSREVAVLLSAFDRPGVNSQLYIDTFLMLALNRLVSCASNAADARKLKYAKGGLPNWRLKRALQLLEGDLSKSHSLSDIAESIRLHPTSFCRAFKQSTGQSPHRYLLAHRVDRAKEMMNDHERSLTQIALDCGFRLESVFGGL